MIDRQGSASAQLPSEPEPQSPELQPDDDSSCMPGTERRLSVVTGTGPTHSESGVRIRRLRAQWNLVGAARRAFIASLTGVIATSIVARPTAADPPTSGSAHLALRKASPHDELDSASMAVLTEGMTEGQPGADVRSDAEGASLGLEVVETLGTLFNIHTGEAMPLSSDEPTLERFSATLSDRVTGARVELDPRLLDLLRRIARRNPGSRIELVSGFRSPKLNEMLRKKGHNVASHSQHSLGRACDFRIIGLTPAQMKKEVLALGWEGGIGRYDKRSDWFVHADVGPKRAWYGGR